LLSALLHLPLAHQHFLVVASVASAPLHKDFEHSHHKHSANQFSLVKPVVLVGLLSARLLHFDLEENPFLLLPLLPHLLLFPWSRIRILSVARWLSVAFIIMITTAL
jgi:hypothetical protein